MAEQTTQSRSTQDSLDESRVIREVLKALQNIRFGSVEITVHEGRATLIERKEKVRLQ